MGTSASASAPITIEQTSKKYKLLRALGVLILLGSVVIGFLSADEYGAGEGWGKIVTATGCVLGIATFGVGVALSWWHHG